MYTRITQPGYGFKSFLAGLRAKLAATASQMIEISTGAGSHRPVVSPSLPKALAGIASKSSDLSSLRQSAG